jgi:uncharacterized protein YebE (UPF0316 family)
MLDAATLLTGLVIFCARVLDVGLGTIRTLTIVQGRTATAFALGFVEISIWLWVISTVVPRIAQEPFLGLFYAFGFATGNVLGIKMEKRMAFGHLILRVITRLPDLADAVRRAGFAVTTFAGQGMAGPVTELYIVCRRRDLKPVIDVVKKKDPDAFYLTEHTGEVSKACRPFLTRPTGWRAVGKRK